jgi:hypothetical protein
VSDPGEADFAFSDFREVRADVITGTLGKQRGNEDGGEKIALVPVRTRNQSDASGAFVFSAVVRPLANNVPSAFFRKRNRHCCASI